MTYLYLLQIGFYFTFYTDFAITCVCGTVFSLFFTGPDAQMSSEARMCNLG